MQEKYTGLHCLQICKVTNSAEGWIRMSKEVSFGNYLNKVTTADGKQDLQALRRAYDHVAATIQEKFTIVSSSFKKIIWFISLLVIFPNEKQSTKWVFQLRFHKLSTLRTRKACGVFNEPQKIEWHSFSKVEIWLMVHMSVCVIDYHKLPLIGST